ncbi:hypothetical protein DBR11_18150 [Pedobacter sp. HMWF019]|nr:hypothetical protein DBR11_18150 [Pedobacter sp. HMWF019]
MRQILNFRDHKKANIFFIIGVIVSLVICYLTFKIGIFIPIMVIGISIGIAFLIATFLNPRVAIIVYFIYCFVVSSLLKNVSGVPFGPVMETLMVLTWLGMLVNKSKYNWSAMKNDYVYIALAWFIINILEIVNPAGASLLGWMNEVRFTTLNWLLLAPLAFILFTRKKDIDFFIALIIGCSVLAAIYGMKQLFIGVSPMEQKWLDDGAAFTHIVFGKLRVFSFYTDAGQFGASQAEMCLVALVLALGPFKIWKRILLFIAAGILFYGMLISGTRGALFALISAAFFAIFLSKNFKVLIAGSVIALCFLGFLKYTTIGNGVYQINRLRTALDPTDPSLNARFINQAKLKEVLSHMPFGGGVGVSGMNGTIYNPDKLLSTIPPDSYWVKVWTMYGIVGLLIWFCMNMFILGKCCGIAWNIQDPKLRVKVIALTAGTAGLFFCSYGNEVMNGFPSSMILYMSWGFIYCAPRFDTNIEDLKLTT